MKQKQPRAQRRKEPRECESLPEAFVCDPRRVAAATHPERMF